MRKLAACVIVKNEEMDLAEWCAYHLAVGVEYFYVYDNDSVVPAKQTLAPYIKMGVVDVVRFPGHNRQTASYMDCIRCYGSENEWIAFIDADEFIVPKSANNIPDVLVKYRNFASLQVHWRMFGSNGHIARPTGLLMENYTWADTGNPFTKAIVQPQYVSGAGDAHFFVHHTKFPVSEHLKRIHGSCNTENPTTDTIQINHYWCKSRDDFVRKQARGNPDGAPMRRMEEWAEHDTRVKEENFDIQRYIDKTKVIMARANKQTDACVRARVGA